MGGKTGSVGGIGAVVGGAIGFAIGGPAGAASGAAIGASIGGGAGAAVGGASDAAAAARKMTAQMNNATRQEQKPTIPTQDSEALRNSRNMRALQLSQRSGRASTFLTDKFGG